MTHLNLMGQRAGDIIIERGFKLLKMVWAPANNAVLDKGFPPYVEMNPAGAVNILMPAVTPDMAGLMFWMSNISANAITLQSSGGAGFTTAIVIAGGENTWVVCTGSTTAGLGWRAGATAPST